MNSYFVLKFLAALSDFYIFPQSMVFNLFLSACCGSAAAPSVTRVWTRQSSRRRPSASSVSYRENDVDRVTCVGEPGDELPPPGVRRRLLYNEILTDI